MHVITIKISKLSLHIFLIEETKKPNLSINLSSYYWVPAWYESLEMRMSSYWPLKLIVDIQDLLLKSPDFE